MLQIAADKRKWEAVQARDAGQDGAFVYGVSSTGVYCRPSCPSRRPYRSRVRFFDDASAAEIAGYRPCRRCRPDEAPGALLRQLELVRHYIDSHPGENVTLHRLGELAGMSPYHLQRTFKRMMGLSPKAYASARRMELMKVRLRKGDTVSRATYDAGYGSESRVYEQARRRLGMTPGIYKKGGRGLTIRYAVATYAVGEVLVAATDRGLCTVTLGDDPVTLERQLRAEYPAATLERTDGDLKLYAEMLLERLTESEGEDWPLDVAGTAFQWQVWDALRRIPPGETRSYQAIARELGRPKAARAVARACASNRLALVIPCHRAVSQQGEPGGYRWGPERKRQILERESAGRDSRREATVPA